MTFRQLQYKLSGRGYKQQKFGITYHFAWLLGLAWGIQDNFTKTDYRLEDHSKIKCFDAPYLKTMSSDNGGWVRYQTLPASMHGHHVNIDYYDIVVNWHDMSRVKYPSGFYHCVDCKLMGTTNTMKEYSCLPPKASLLIHYRRDYYIPTEEDLDKYMSIRTEAGWWKRKSLRNEAEVYYLERKWIKPG